MTAIVPLLILAIALVAAGTVYLRSRTLRVVRCPDTGGIAQVQTGLLDEALNTLRPEREFRIRKCTRWPEQPDCVESCLQQIEAAPIECRLRTIIKKWYEGRSCSSCQKAIDVSGPFNGSCAVVAPNGHTRDWSDLTDEELARVLTVYEPICWQCHVDATFRRVASES